jgi:acyl-CoA synthetase (NDP forming)
MRDAWTTMQELIETRANAGFVVQRNAPAGIPVSIRAVEDPLFGPVVSFGLSGMASDLLGDRAFRIPPMDRLDTEEEMRDAWTTMQELIETRANAGFVVQRNAPAGIPVSIRAVEDPLFGPVVSFGLSGMASDLLGDRAFRIPPMDRLDSEEMVREIRAAPLLLGYRGSEPVDVDAVETLLLHVAQLKNDLPQVRSLDLSLVVVGLQGLQVLTASATVEPATDARSDWYVRRMAGAGDTRPG